MKNNKNLTDEVINYIFSGNFKVGGRLPPEREMAATLGVSRAKIREVIQSLCSVGYLRSVRGSGTYLVKSNDIMTGASAAAKIELEFEGKKLEEIWQVRYILETAAAGIAAERATQEDITSLRETFLQYETLVRQGAADGDIVEATMAFHSAIIRATHNYVLQDIVENMSDLMRFTRNKTQTVSDSGARAVEHHKKLLLAITSRDPDCAKECMREHLLDVRRDIRVYLNRPEQE